MLTNQEVFDTVVEHLFKQNTRCMATGLNSNPNVTCAYRGDNGMTCAVGCLIPPALMAPAFEGASYLALRNVAMGEGTRLGSKTATFTADDRKKARMLYDMLGGATTEYVLTSLQSIHDDSMSWGYKNKGLSQSGITRLRDLAKGHNLDTTVLDRCAAEQDAVVYA